MLDQIGKCRSCGAPVLWSETTTGRRMPLNVEPTEKGNIILGKRHNRMPLALVQVEQKLAEYRARGELLYVSHFATCPHGKRWRKKNERK